MEGGVRRVPVDAGPGAPFEAFSPDDYDRYCRRQAARRRDAVVPGVSGYQRCPRVTPTMLPGSRPFRASATARTSCSVHRLASGHVEVFDGSIGFVRAVRAEGLADRGGVFERQRGAGAQRRPGSTASSTRVSTGSPRASAVWPASRRRTRSSPVPSRSGSTAATAAVFEDALAGVEAGRAGVFVFVVGVNRVDHADASAQARRRRRRPRSERAPAAR